ncbi:MAG: SDR family oxidoreductase [Polyangiaceae bacterium]|nr:SDR family oxidoreductase [Polyangiaceae bacterium]
MQGKPPSPSDIEACARVLEVIAEDRSLLAGLDESTRRRLLIAAGRVSRPERSEQRDLAKAFRRKEAQERRAADEALLQKTTIRALREIPVYPTPSATFTHPSLPEAGRPASDSGEASSAPPPLHEARKCYVCKAPFREVHFFYDQMCPACGDFNYQKRTQTARLDGRVAIVTGARVKIGYQAAIKLLRAGARVIVTTRFPHDAARRYAEEADYEDFSDRLQIYGLDLRHTPSVERFAKYLNNHLDRLDFILHNACQTVRRPPGFYSHLMASETRPASELSPAARALVYDYDALRARGDAPALSTLTERGDIGLVAPALLSQIAAVAGDLEAAQMFPDGTLDADQQQVDLRNQNSWRLLLAEVPTVELFEVMLVNAIAPFVLSARLKPLMVRQPSRDKHIVNVSAMEGQFYRPWKTDKHPHTNMAKAALNMLTRTSAADYIKDGIHINSVDTGWVTDEDPAEIAARKVEEHGFHPPLDIVDGAARIVDPIFSGFLTGRHVFGLFLKDYLPTDW